MKSNKIALVLNNGKKRKRYLVKLGTEEWASALHCAEALGINVREIYKAVDSFLSLGTKYNERGLIRRHFHVAGHKLFITIHNVDYDQRSNEALPE